MHCVSISLSLSLYIILLFGLFKIKFHHTDVDYVDILILMSWENKFLTLEVFKLKINSLDDNVEGRAKRDISKQFVEVLIIRKLFCVSEK